MSLLTEARAKSVRIPPVCNVRKALAAHPKLAGEIEEVIRDKTVPHATAESVFRDRNILITQFDLSRHRLNQCVGCRQAGYKW